MVTITKANIISACSPIIGQESLIKDFRCQENRHRVRLNNILNSLIKANKIRKIEINGMPFYEAISSSDLANSDRLEKLPCDSEFGTPQGSALQV